MNYLQIIKKLGLDNKKNPLMRLKLHTEMTTELPVALFAALIAPFFIYTSSELGLNFLNWLTEGKFSWSHFFWCLFIVVIGSCNALFFCNSFVHSFLSKRYSNLYITQKAKQCLNFFMRHKTARLNSESEQFTSTLLPIISNPQYQKTILDYLEPLCRARKDQKEDSKNLYEHLQCFIDRCASKHYKLALSSLNELHSRLVPELNAVDSQAQTLKIQKEVETKIANKNHALDHFPDSYRLKVQLLRTQMGVFEALPHLDSEQRVLLSHLDESLYAIETEQSEGHANLHDLRQALTRISDQLITIQTQYTEDDKVRLDKDARISQYLSDSNSGASASHMSVAL